MNNPMWKYYYCYRCRKVYPYYPPEDNPPYGKCTVHSMYMRVCGAQLIHYKKDIHLMQCGSCYYRFRCWTDLKE